MVCVIWVILMGTADFLEYLGVLDKGNVGQGIEGILLIAKVIVVT
jgi:hypothetical protein